VKALAISGLKKGQSLKTVQNVVRCLSSLLSHAVEDGQVAVNVALKPGKFLPKISKRMHINPYTGAELATFLATVQSHDARYYPLFLCAARTGLRQGELLALQWENIHMEGRFIDVPRNYSRGTICTPKSGEGRRVDMSKELGKALKQLHAERQAQATANGAREMPQLVFCNEAGGIIDPDNLRKRIFRSLLKASGLRRTRFHDLRHTFASLLLQQGESLLYVKEQRGHSSIQVTVDLYGHLIPGGNNGAVDRLDSPTVKSVSVSPIRNPGATVAPSKGVAVRWNLLIIWSRRLESNQRPAVYETAALPTELRRRGMTRWGKGRYRTDAMIAMRLRACQSSSFAFAISTARAAPR